MRITGGGDRGDRGGTCRRPLSHAGPESPNLLTRLVMRQQLEPRPQQGSGLAEGSSDLGAPCPPHPPHPETEEAVSTSGDVSSDSPLHGTALTLRRASRPRPGFWNSPARAPSCIRRTPAPRRGLSADSAEPGARACGCRAGVRGLPSCFAPQSCLLRAELGGRGMQWLLNVPRQLSLSSIAAAGS